MTRTKCCGRCHQEKALDEFAVSSSAKTGRQSYCRPCFREYKLSRYVRVMLAAAKRRAQKQGVPFSLTTFDVYIPERCPALGIPLVPCGGTRDAAPSLDRIVPALGYVPGNVQVISNKANRIKSDADPAEIIRLACYLQQIHTSP